MLYLEIVIIILLVRMIQNQHTIDEHIQENKSLEDADYVHWDGFINKWIFRFTVLYKNIIYYIKHRGK